MSIGTFVTTSFELLPAGKYDVALSLACSAVDATAAKLYGKSISNNERYKKFLRDKMSIVTQFGFPGVQAGAVRIKCNNVPGLRTDQDGYVGIEDILYHTLRCGLLHQCEIDARIEFISKTYIGDFSGKFRLPHHVIFGLLLAVVFEKRNAAESIPSEIQLQLNGHLYALEKLWGIGGANFVAAQSA